MRKGHLVIIVILIFILSIAVRYWPVFHKGYSYNISAVDLVLARNLSSIGEYKMIDKKDVVLSSSLVAKEGILSDRGNKLTPILYSKIFDIFGFNQVVPLYVSLFLYGITTVLLFLLVLKLFNFKLALIFIGIDILMPFVLAGSVWFGFYEFGMLFFIFAIFIYLWKKEVGWLRLFLSGLFFGLAALARNAFLISFIPFLLYDFYSNILRKSNWKKVQSWIGPAAKRGFIFILPIILLWGGVMLSDYSKGIINHYLVKGDMGYDGHLFRDPYTYHFDKDSYIKEIQGTTNGETIYFLKRYNYDISWKQHFFIYFYSVKYYLNEFFRQPTIGGPLIIFFLILGAIYLFKTWRRLLNLIVFWIGILFFILVFLGTSNWDHFLEIRFPLVLLVSLGLYWILNWLRKVVISKKVYYWLAVGLFLVSFLHLIQADKWMFHEKYLYSRVEEKVSLVESIKKSNIDVGVNDIIAISKDPIFLNYYTDLNYIYFTPETIKKLLQENKLQWVFDQFGVTKIAGYDNDLTKEMVKSADVDAI